MHPNNYSTKWSHLFKSEVVFKKKSDIKNSVADTAVEMGEHQFYCI